MAHKGAAKLEVLYKNYRRYKTAYATLLTRLSCHSHMMSGY